MVLLDLSHTSHCAVHTGVQRVCRSLFEALDEAGQCLPICFDPYQNDWRSLDPWERQNLRPLFDAISVTSRKAHWTGWQKIQGRARRMLPFLFNFYQLPNEEFEGLLVPEIFGPHYGPILDAAPANLSGPKIALFHDAVAINFPEYTPVQTVKRFPLYLKNLLKFDGIAAISEASKEELLTYWRMQGITDHPPVKAIPLGSDLFPAKNPMGDPNGKEVEELPVVLMVGTIEGRKNHLNLFRAAEKLWAAGLKFKLRLVGACNTETAGEALRLMEKLEKAERPLTWIGHISEERIKEEYRNCYFSIYPSFYEGFGLPVLESLSCGKPSICSNRGALAEISRGGGCLVLRDVNEEAIFNGIRLLLEDRPLYLRLVSEARQRTLKSWKEYSEELMEWVRSLALHRSGVFQGRKSREHRKSPRY